MAPHGGCGRGDVVELGAWALAHSIFLRLGTDYKYLHCTLAFFVFQLIDSGPPGGVEGEWGGRGLCLLSGQLSILN